MTDDRTEPATPKRRKKAREEGQVARSAELVSCVILLLVLHAVGGLGPELGRHVFEYAAETLGSATRAPEDPETLGRMTRHCLMQVSVIAGPVMGMVVLAAVASNMAQVGFLFSSKQLQPKLNRIDPLSGMRRLFGFRSAVEIGKGLAKMGIVIYSGWSYLVEHQTTLLMVGAADPQQIAPRIGQLAHGLALRMIGTLAVLAALDYAYQRWQLERNLRMTKQEVKDEFRESEGNPEIKRRIRQRQREGARRRMMADVEAASVVITNPTHFAVALKYDVGQKGAPKVVAKGQDLIAKRIREVAEAASVPLVQNPPLARSLFRACDIGEEIPAELYRAVAEVLAFIWRLDARRRSP